MADIQRYIKTPALNESEVNAVLSEYSSLKTFHIHVKPRNQVTFSDGLIFCTHPEKAFPKNWSDISLAKFMEKDRTFSNIVNLTEIISLIIIGR